MIAKSKIDSIVREYGKDVTIATACSHTALQIFHGAKLEGLKTLGLTTAKKEKVYNAFPLARPDKYIRIEKMSDMLLPEVQQQLVDEHCIVVPHGSFVEYIGPKNIEDRFEVPMLGNRAVLDWESDRDKERDWLKAAGCKVPERISDPSEINKPCLVKFHGAKGGHGFFIALNEEEFYKKLGDRTDKYMIQEFILGTRYYYHFFYSPISKRGYPAGTGSVELMSIDCRNEANIDELHRFGFTREELRKVGLDQTFVVTGNIPLVLRESLLDKVLEDAKNVVDQSIKMFSPGMVGPFCLETIMTDHLESYVFEISGRIVAGTNLYPMGSPYSPYTFNQPMSTGRRIAVEVKDALAKGQLSKVVY